MDISEIKDGMRRVDAYGQIVSVGEARTVKTKQGDAQVADAVLRDATGEIGLSLWDDQIQQVAAGAYVKIGGGMVRTWQARLQLSVGRYGRLEVAPGGREPVEDQPPPALACPSCGFTNAGHPGWKFCPEDGERLG